MLKERVITALWGLPLLIIAVWFDEPLPWFAVLVALWGLGAVCEFYRLVGVFKVRSLAALGIFGTLLFILSPYCPYGLTVPLLLTATVVLPLGWLVLRPEKEGAFLSWAWTIAGALYVGWLLSYLVALRLEAGREWVFLALFGTFGSDTAAFFVGRALGRRPLAPRISPRKTWEGAIGGVLGAVIVSLLFTLPTPLNLPLSYGQAVLLGLLISVFGQFGDLVESLLKRNTGAKESGKLLPGHGGFLDRMDSLVFAGVVVYLYYIFAVV
ncbi:MAG TPA: phosphatidate cytidylyltransferase [Dehalococcoidia bacterium]|jgi:phosphatidate cytidylyltransferase|nr:phosphatidate cytidylyltransferase [Dehalococcoidia bacterium]